ncbi:MAG TPA: hypothetical protein VM120_17660 [Bryobacteraceae bacterium]|nr:hypothetical protein [Bryobacteraceae bacterium]
MLPADAEGFVMPSGMRSLEVEGVGKFAYNAKELPAKEIRRAMKKNRLSEILGAKEGGYGAPDKTMLGPEQMIVVARNEKGIVTQEILTDKANLDRTMQVAGRLGKVSIEDIEQTITRRQAVQHPEVMNGTANQPGASPAASLEAVNYGAFSDARPPKNPIIYGSEISLGVPEQPGKFIAARWALWELDDIHPSHDPKTLAPNENFQLINQRSFDDPESMASLKKMTEEFDPAASLTHKTEGAGILYPGPLSSTRMET